MNPCKVFILLSLCFGCTTGAPAPDTPVAGPPDPATTAMPTPPDEKPAGQHAEETRAEGIQPDTVIGAWQLDGPDIGAGLGPTFHFFNDGLFVYHAGSQTCTPGVVARVGTWEVSGPKLILKEERRLLQEGGQTVIDDTGCFLEGSSKKALVHTTAVVEELAMEHCTALELEAFQVEEHDVQCMKLDDQNYWTIAGDTERWRDQWRIWFEEK